ncbi:ABC transporter ATP-binding protein [Nitrosovibrio tenuis]|uniref:ATP-binding cassette, subfamily B, multidrug efflux pump n=1 Tax=Nitrosovibrio tenuis TaxID=1233 RepID=A0A1H7ID19_9PROT|nr:ABC transporter ATP-binding protein [Nitrosovibrio tenuis]SEK60463.1 ATP-binding cassette, subfamily B, multidrug efflux pump [Nitrosovibrio tenuis]
MFKFFEKLIHPYPDSKDRIPPKGFFAFMWEATEGVRRYLVAMTLLTAAIGAFEAILFAILGKVVDWLSHIPPSLLWHQERNTLLLFAGLLAASPLLVAVQNFFKHQVLGGNFPMRLRWNFHRMMLNQSMNFYQDEFAGRVAAKVMQTALALRDVCFILGDILIYVTIYFFTLVAVVGSFNVWLSIPFIAWLILYIFALWFFVPRMGRVSQSQADARALMTGRISDAYTNIATVKLFSHAGKEAGYARSAMQEFLETVHKQMRLITTFEVVNQIMGASLIISAVGIALLLWTKDLIGVGALAAVGAMSLRLNGMSHWVMWEMSSLFEHIGTVRDGINTLSRAHLVTDHPGAKPLQIAKADIKFEDVLFCYGGDTAIIDHLSLHIGSGEKIGLVGRSGAGKSTLVNLLLRFYDVEQGRILIDAQDIKYVTQNSLRANIGMVTQDTSLLHRSVRDNILYGRPEATEMDMIAAAKKAEAHDFIAGLTDPMGRKGYDAHVGERGIKLSGGQRQRIAIARVMLKDAPVLLLDEATSALDSEVEAAIQSSLYRLMEGKTVIAIAHRLSTIAAMDRLIVIEKGRIVEEGNHQSLIELNGLYARLWAHQSGGFLGADV